MPGNIFIFIYFLNYEENPSNHSPSLRTLGRKSVIVSFILQNYFACWDPLASCHRKIIHSWSTKVYWLNLFSYADSQRPNIILLIVQCVLCPGAKMCKCNNVYVLWYTCKTIVNQDMKARELSLHVRQKDTIDR